MGALQLKVQEKWLLDKANDQFGLLRDDDLIGRIGRSAVRGRRQTCRLTRLHPGIYAFGHTALRDEAHWLAALWDAGRSATLSHHTAARFHGWTVPSADDRTHVTITGTTQSHDGAVVVHRTRNLDEADVYTREPFRVTHQPRTLVDLADVLDWIEYRRLADNLPSLAIRAIREAQARAPNRSGAPLVTRLVEADDAHTKSEFERRFLRFLSRHGLPRPDHLNHDVGGHKADCVFDAAKLVVELDGRAFHRRRGQLRADRQRDSDYQLAGYWILRLVWDDLHDAEATATAARVRRMLRLNDGP